MKVFIVIECITTTEEIIRDVFANSEDAIQYKKDCAKETGNNHIVVEAEVRGAK